MFVATIGFFDGVHRGHRCLIDQVLGLAGERGERSMIVTMDRHPREVVMPDQLPKLLTSNDERLQLLKATGVDEVHVLKFDETMSKLTAREFMRMLAENLGVNILVMGYDHHFGHDGGSFEDYQRWGRECGIEVVLAHRMEGEKASSTICRRLLAEGDVKGARHILGHEYLIMGVVVAGHRIGRQIGFPTANLKVDERKLLPKDGVYACRVQAGSCGSCGSGGIKGILNIGMRPTLDNGSDRSVEVHIIGHCGDIYGQTLQLQLVRRIRGERKFSSLKELKTQIEQDIESLRD